MRNEKESSKARIHSQDPCHRIKTFIIRCRKQFGWGELVFEVGDEPEKGELRVELWRACHASVLARNGKPVKSLSRSVARYKLLMKDNLAALLSMHSC